MICNTHRKRLLLRLPLSATPGPTAGWHTGQLAAGMREQREKQKKPSKNREYEEIDGGDEMEKSGNDNNYPGKVRSFTHRVSHLCPLIHFHSLRQHSNIFNSNLLHYSRREAGLVTLH